MINILKFVIKLFRKIIASYNLYLIRPQLSSLCLRQKSHDSHDGHDDKKRQLINHSRIRGIDILRNPKLNKVSLFSAEQHLFIKTS